jgi:hypothetical protein
VTPCYVVISAQIIGRMQTKVQFKQVLTSKASEVAVVELRKHNNYVGIGVRGLFECELKGFVVAGAPGDFNASPLLGYSPFWFQEKMSPVDNFVLSKEVVVGDPLDNVSLDTSLPRRMIE